MPIFKGQNNNYLLTNFKVMYSTLSHADSLEPVKLDRRLKRDMLLSKLKLRSDKFYFICRNPYRRLESFFREKFRNKVDYFERNGYWQDGQKLFFPYLHIDESFTPEDIKQKLLDTSFSKLITILPEVYLKDRHLRPQWLRLRVSFTKWGIPFRFKVPLVQILKIESMEELDFLNQIFNVDVNKRLNASADLRSPIEWSKNDIQIVQELYKNDFNAFGYDPKNFKKT